MMLSKRRKIWLIIIMGGVLAIGLILWGSNRWMERKIVAVLNSDGHEIEYETVKVDVLLRKIVLQQFQWSQDPSFATIQRVQLRNISLLKYLWKSRMVIGSVEIDHPVFHLERLDNDTTASSSPEFLQHLHSIEIGKVVVRNGKISFSQNDTTFAPVLISFPSLEVEEVFTDREKIKQDIPFDFGTFSAETDSFFYQIDELYELSVQHIQVKEEDVRMDTLRLQPRFGKQEFQNHIPFQKTRADLMVPRMMLKGFTWEKSDDLLFFSASSLELDSADLQLFRDKTLDENPIVKPLYSKMLRELPFWLKVDSVQVNEGKITYEILFQEDRDPGMVYLEQVQGRIKDLTNRGMGGGDFPRTRVYAGALFMKESKIDLDWSFFVDDPADEFRVSGSLSRITDRGMNFFLEPAFHVSAEGAIDALQFNFQGDDIRAEGAMRMKYEKFKIEWLTEDGRPKKVLSMLSNLFLHNKLSGPAEKEGIEVERVQTKSFWAYLWKMVQTGSLEFLL